MQTIVTTIGFVVMLLSIGVVFEDRGGDESSNLFGSLGC